VKICYITHASNLTGANQSLLDILSYIQNSKIEPFVLLRSPGPIEDELEKRNIPYNIIPYKNSVMPSRRSRYLAKLLYNHVAALRIQFFFKRQQFDIIHNNCLLASVGMEAAYRAGIPYICHNRELIWEDHHVQLMNWRRQLFLLKNAAIALEISDYVCRKFQVLVPEARFRVLHDGIDINKYYQMHDELFNKNTIQILFAGRISETKRPLEAIKALESLQKRCNRTVKLIIAGCTGKGEYESEIRNYVTSRNIQNIIFQPFCDLQQLRRESDIVLMCSEAEGLGRVTIEGQLSGCLVIGAAAGATKEIIKNNETGLLYELGNPKNLADMLLYALEHPKEMNQIAQRGQTFAKEKFDISSYVSKLNKIYSSIVENNK